MCLIVFDWRPGEDHWLRLSANRDEFFKRPTQAMHAWPEQPGLWAGKDLEQGGTWMGVTESGRWSALTNVRVLGVGPEEPRSRGELVLHYLISSMSPDLWLNTIDSDEYAPFNLLLGNKEELWYLTNYPERHAERLDPGLYSLSNASLNSPWPKAELARQQLSEHAGDELAGLLSRREVWPDEQLPDTGVPLAWERMLSAQFISAPGYGTRCSTGIHATGSQLALQEITWDESGTESERRNFTIVLKDR